MPTEVNGWRFPDSVEAPSEDSPAWYRIPFGDNVVNGLSWQSHVEMLHDVGVERLDTKVVDTGVDADGVRYAVVKATVEIEGGTFSSIQAADETSNQVRDPEFVWAVAESRALKRVIKKSLNIVPVDKSTVMATDEEAASSEDHVSRTAVDRSADSAADMGPAADVETTPAPSSSESESEPESEGTSGGDDEWDW